MFNATDEDFEYKTFTEYKAYRKISIFVPPFLILIGTISNMLAVVVLTRPKLRKSKTMFYLTVLSLADIAVLNVGLLLLWLHRGFDINLAAKSYTGCKIVGFSVYFSTDFCNWILVAMTVDRCVSVCLPFRFRQFCTHKSAKLVVLVMAVLMFLINMHLLWGLSLVESSDGKICLWVNEFTHYIWPWIDMCMYSLFPFIIIIVCNACLIHNMASSNRKISTVIERNPENLSRRRQRADDRRPKPLSKGTQLSKVTRMLQVMNVTFFVLTVPIVLWGPYYHLHPTADTPHGQATMLLIEAIVNILQYMNNSGHFFLYCLTSSSFRRELCAMYRQFCSDDDDEDDVQFIGVNNS